MVPSRLVLVRVVLFHGPVAREVSLLTRQQKNDDRENDDSEER